MSSPADKGRYDTKLSLSDLIVAYASLQNKVLDQINSLASSMSTADPGEFLLAQFGMSQVNQIGQTISNMIYQVNSVIMNTIRNQKVQ